MGRKDTLTKEYMSRNDIFADVFNYVLYGGQIVVSREELVDRDTTEIALPIGKNGEMIPIQRYRDVLKGLIVKESPDTIYALLGIENQSEIHYAMPVKNLLYDSLNYASQVSKKSAEYRKTRKEQKENKFFEEFKETTAEFLSGFHKGDKLKPVITVTVYLGTKEWDAPRNIRDMFDNQNEVIMNYIPDYQIPLIIPNEITDFENFQSEFGCLMHIIKASESRSEMDKIFTCFWEDDDEISKTAVAILKEFIGLSFEMPEKGEKIKMAKVCKAWEEQKQLGIEEGRQEGRQEERKSIILQLNKEGFSTDMIARILQISVKDVEQIIFSKLK